MSQSKTGNVTHDTTVAAAEAARQSAARASGVSQATTKTAEITFYRACLASAKANSIDQGPFLHALWTLGVRDP